MAYVVHGWLIDAGHEVFLAQDRRGGIAVGEQWEQRLHEELRLADAVVCVVASVYLASRWCTVEVGIARDRPVPGQQVATGTGRGVVADPRLKSVEHIALARDPDLVRPVLVEALCRTPQVAGGATTGRAADEASDRRCATRRNRGKSRRITSYHQGRWPSPR